MIAVLNGRRAYIFRALSWINSVYTVLTHSVLTLLISSEEAVNNLISAVCLVLVFSYKVNLHSCRYLLRFTSSVILCQLLPRIVTYCYVFWLRFIQLFAVFVSMWFLFVVLSSWVFILQCLVASTNRPTRPTLSVEYSCLCSFCTNRTVIHNSS